MRNIICSNCGQFMGKSSREINECHKDDRWNEAMRIRLWCLDCCRKNTIESLKDTSLEESEPR